MQQNETGEWCQETGEELHMGCRSKENTALGSSEKPSAWISSFLYIPVPWYPRGEKNNEASFLRILSWPQNLGKFSCFSFLCFPFSLSLSPPPLLSFFFSVREDEAGEVSVLRGDNCQASVLTSWLLWENTLSNKWNTAFLCGSKWYLPRISLRGPRKKVGNKQCLHCY